MEIVVMLLMILVTFAIFFAASFTAVTLFIMKRRAVHKKYHFSDVATVPESNIQVDRNSPYSSVDSESARQEWGRKNNQQF